MITFLRRTLRTSTSNRVDVVIVGTGFAGLAAAVEARNMSASVCVLEKMPSAGGNSIWSAGQVAAAGSPQQRATGIVDTPEQMAQDMFVAGEEMNHPKLVETLCNHSAETAAWLTGELGLKFRERVTQLGGHSVARTLSTPRSSGRDIVEPLLTKAVVGGARIRLNAEVTRLLHDNDDGVVGVEIQGGEKIYASKVILATGGFAADKDFVAAQQPSLAMAGTTNQPGATAGALRAAMRSGANTIQLDQIQMGPWASPEETGFGRAPLFVMGAGFPYGIVLDPATSHRCMNEMAGRKVRSQKILKLGHPVICVADSQAARHSLDKNSAKVEAIHEFQTLEDLAAAFKLDCTAVKEEIDDVNSYLASRGSSTSRADSWGRVWAKDAMSISKAPFFAVRLWPKVHHCMGGLHINDKSQVISVDLKPIPGLYAAGEAAGGVQGADRLGSCAISDALTFGRIAAQSLI